MPRSIAGFDDKSLQRAFLIVEVSRDLARTTPAPKAAPFFGLDHDQPYDLTVLERLSAPGIFRKYEFLLYLHSGLGGAARWLSQRLGCRIIGCEGDLGRVRAAQYLNGHARMSDQVAFVAMAPEALGFRDQQFTHVWIVDPPPAYRSPSALREARRVLRSGGHFALHTSLSKPDEMRRLNEQILEAGFADLKRCRFPLVPPVQLFTMARRRMRRRLDGGGESAPAWPGGDCDLGNDCLQIFGRRP